MQLHTKHDIDPHLMQLYWQGIQTVQQDKSIDDQLENYPPETYQNLFITQHAIGWDQIYYGRISIQWACQVTINSNYTMNGDQFYATATNIVWKYILDCWTQRNQALHDPQTVPPNARVLADQVHQIFETAAANPELATLLPRNRKPQYYRNLSGSSDSGPNRAKLIWTTSALLRINALHSTLTI